ncbi:MAG TPA: L-threonylcarbamoyladenylate synthase [Candidatus Binatia bacterium]|nr:L-threonylcarbamoyladenylate synthase [Candidatus Binatia bacterium]
MSESHRIDPQHPDPVLIHRAAGLLREGRLVAYPTETFYGLAADPRSERAIEAVFAAKGRPERLALPLIASDRRSVLDAVSEFSDAAERLAAAFWPGALTLVLPASLSLPPRLLGNGRTVGIRISPHSIAAALASAFGSAIVATSANRSGRDAPVTAQEVGGDLGGEVALILDGGPTSGGHASTVLDLTTDPPRVVRSGAVPLSAIEEILGRRIT